jgi:hypothetical protein
MSYLLFNSAVYAGDGLKLERAEKGANLSHLLNQSQQVHVCVVDVDVLIASASDNAPDKKDGILAKKFSDTYQGEYVLQDERLANNIFQVIGIKAEKVKEVYALVAHDKIATFVPYAVAARKLIAQQRFEADKTVVLLDDLGHEKLITVFEGLKFSRTRSLFNGDPQQILSEIKRSVINFEKKLAEQKDKNADGVIIVTNNEALGENLKEIEKDITIEFLNSACLALDGLKIGGLGFKYILPAEIIKKRREEEARQRLRSLSVSMFILATGGIFYFFNQLTFSLAQRAFAQEQGRRLGLESALNKLDPAIYRDVLQRQKKTNYALYFLSTVNSLPVSYEIHSFVFHRQGEHFAFQGYLYMSDDGLFDDILPVGFLKGAYIKDLLVNHRSGKYLRMEL